MPIYGSGLKKLTPRSKAGANDMIILEFNFVRIFDFRKEVASAKRGSALWPQRAVSLQVESSENYPAQPSTSFFVNKLNRPARMLEAKHPYRYAASFIRPPLQ